ncbi:MAG: hypothetical protein ACRCSK_02285 [Fusobacteriaceae bacterium]
MKKIILVILLGIFFVECGGQKVEKEINTVINTDSQNQLIIKIFNYGILKTERTYKTRYSEIIKTGDQKKIDAINVPIKEDASKYDYHEKNYLKTGELHFERFFVDTKNLSKKTMKIFDEEFPIYNLLLRFYSKSGKIVNEKYYYPENIGSEKNIETIYYENGKIKSALKYEKVLGEKNSVGLYQEFYESGKIKTEYQFIYSKTLDEEGNPYQEITKRGFYREYDEKGVLIKEEKF